MKKPQPIALRVINSVKLSANMQRITLQGKELAIFPDDCQGGYVKLLFNAQGGTDLSQVAPEQRPVMRTYTIAHYSPSALTIDIDFVRHETPDLSCGFAARWAKNATVGASISITGPGLLIDMKHNADWLFAVADMTALPALAAKIARLPNDACGYAVIKVLSHDDIRSLEMPENIEVIWLLDGQSLSEKVRALTWLGGEPFVWVACEFESMRALRAYFRNEKAVPKEDIYISSYWKQGLTEDGHKVVKREDASALLSQQ
ncbi:NADPH-dependent ferric siderophore reductase [Psychromonas sp. psych-6C06]|uniref:siderophore-interacting protein n=1 Tax=Psychromonas sp. psych-6C06 TaxID=2058089 RepID=UPI000C34215F|nr:siderophore-interacting protein [Psychromonas sp. psych-6C06]PKF61549.1 NADPH-dependent ferric siderophore reductase [Psychromonas sp. psych-6C06]